MAKRSHLVATFKEGLRPVVDLVFPPRCPSCGAPLAVQGGLCSDCWGEIEFSQSSTQSAEEVPTQSEIISACRYNDSSRKLILAFKHGGKISLAPLLASLIAAQMEDADDTSALLVPVPLHRSRLWQRGFNQAALLARELEIRGKGELIVDALVRTKRTPSLGALGSDERAKTLENAISVRPRSRDRINGRNLVLVDDVVTSGATSEACSKALIAAGAAQVQVACFAHVDS